MMDTLEPTIPSELIKQLQAARRVTVLTGAGVSAESGLATFRDELTGLWAKYRPEDLATPEAFRRTPRLVWEWYAWRRELAANAAPNSAHLALAELQRWAPEFTLITQNVDGLHQRAGSIDVIELHGSLVRIRCSREGIVIEDWDEQSNVPPLCPRCGAFLRPDIVWFGEPLPTWDLERATAAAENCDLFLSIGTSGVVQPAASLTYLAEAEGATIAVINPDVDWAPARWLTIASPAGKALPALLNAAWPAGSELDHGA